MADERINVEITGDSSSAVRAAAAARAAIEALESAEASHGRTARTASKDTHQLRGAMLQANRTATLFRNTISLIKWPALIAGAGAATQGIGALGAAFVGLSASIAPATGALVAYPALLGAIGQASGVVALAGIDDLAGAVGGLNTKLDETSTQFKQLSPEAQKFARHLNQLKGPIREIQSDVQGPLFAGLDRGIQDARKNLPALNSVLTETSREMGRLAERTGNFLGREGFGRDFEVIGRGNAQLLGDLGDSGLHLADALRHVMVEAQPFLDFLGDSATDLAKMVEQSAKANRENGDLADFFKQSRDTLESLGELTQSFAAGLYAIGKAGRPLGDDILDSLVGSAEAFERWAESASGQNEIRDYFDEARPVIWEVGKLVRDIGAAFFDLSDDSDTIVPLIRSIRKDLLPALVDVTKTTTEAFGPVFIDFLSEASEAFGTLAGTTGPLNIFVKLLTEALKLFNDLIDTIPELGTVLAGALTIKSLSGMAGIAGLLGGGLLGGRRGAAGGRGGGLAGLLGLGGAAAAGGSLLGGGAAAAGDMFGINAASGKAAGGGFLGGVKSVLRSPLGRIGLVGVGLSLADGIFDEMETRAMERSPDLMTRLKGLAEHSDLRVGIGEDGGFPIDITLGASDAEELAEDLGKALHSIANRQRAITAEQREQLQNAADQLDLTEKQREEVEATLDASRLSMQISNLPDTIDDRGPSSLRNIVEEAREAGMAIERSQVEAWVAAGDISSRQGARILDAIRDVRGEARQTERQLGAQRGIGIGVALTKDGKVTEREVERIKDEISLLPPRMQREAGRMTVAWAKNAHEQGDISHREYRNIRETVESEVGKITRAQIREGTKQVRTSAAMYGAMQNVAQIGLSYIAKETAKALGGLGGKKIEWAVDAAKPIAAGLLGAIATRQRGGGVDIPGSGSGDKVPVAVGGVPVAMTEPGEKLFVLNRNASAALEQLHRINHQVPRQGGGLIPGLAAGGGLDFALGPYTIPPIQYDANHAGGNSHVHVTGTTTPWVVALGRQLQGMGFMVGEHPAFGGVQAQHSATGGHYDALAIDVNSAADETRAEVASIARLLGGKGGGFAAAAAREIGKLAVTGPAGSLRGVAQGALDTVRAAANEKIRAAAAARTDITSTPAFSADGGVERVFAQVAKRLSRSRTATRALGMAGYAESGMQDLSYGDASSQGALQLLSSTAAGLGVSPHDEGAIASLFFTRGFYGRGGANALADAGHPAHMVAQLVQGSATSDGSNYLAQSGAAASWMRRFGLRDGGLIALLAEGGGIPGLPQVWENVVDPDKERQARLERRRRQRRRFRKRTSHFGGMEDWMGRIGEREGLALDIEEALSRVERIHSTTDLPENPVEADFASEEGELRTEIGLNSQLLSALYGHRAVFIRGIRESNDRESTLEKQVRQIRQLPKKKFDGEKWRLPILRDAINALNTTERDWEPLLEAVHGRGSPRNLPGPPAISLGGTILDTQLQINELSQALGEVRGVFGPGDDGGLADAEHELRLQAERRAAAASAEFGPLQEFIAQLGRLPYVGAYQQGTGPRGLPATGLYLGHEDEIVLPAGSPMGGNVTLVLADRAAELVQLIDSRVDGRAAPVVNQQLGASSRRIRVAPGRP